MFVQQQIKKGMSNIRPGGRIRPITSFHAAWIKKLERTIELWPPWKCSHAQNIVFCSVKLSMSLLNSTIRCIMEPLTNRKGDKINWWCSRTVLVIIRNTTVCGHACREVMEAQCSCGFSKNEFDTHGLKYMFFLVFPEKKRGKGCR